MNGREEDGYSPGDPKRRYAGFDSRVKHDREMRDLWRREFGPDDRADELSDRYAVEHGQRPEDVEGSRL